MDRALMLTLKGTVSGAATREEYKEAAARAFELFHQDQYTRHTMTEDAIANALVVLSLLSPSDLVTLRVLIASNTFDPVAHMIRYAPRRAVINRAMWVLLTSIGMDPAGMTDAILDGFTSIGTAVDNAAQYVVSTETLDAGDMFDGVNEAALERALPEVTGTLMALLTSLAQGLQDDAGLDELAALTKDAGETLTNASATDAANRIAELLISG